MRVKKWLMCAGFAVWRWRRTMIRSGGLVMVLAIQCLTGIVVAAPSTVVETGGARLPFYEARKGDTRIYILGTMHAGKPGAPLRQDIVQALGHSSALVMELSEADLSSVMPLMMMYLCQDACLRRQISGVSFNKLEQAVGPLAGMGGVLDHVPAWMVALVLASADYAKAGLTPMSGTEMQLLQVWGKRPTVGLETPDEQLKIFASFNDGVQREMLEGYLRLPESKRLELIRNLYKIWQNGDAEALYRWYQQMDAAEGLSPAIAKAVNDEIVVSRNRRFVERLLQQPISPDKPVFLAVGALHLGGPEGVLSLLQKQGFSLMIR